MIMIINLIKEYRKNQRNLSKMQQLQTTKSDTKDKNFIYEYKVSIIKENEQPPQKTPRDMNNKLPN